MKRAETHYGSGSLYGPLVTDDIYLKSSDNSSKQIHLSNFTFGLIEDQQDVFGVFDIDCIFGLGYKNFEKPETKYMSNFFDAIVDSK